MNSKRKRRSREYDVMINGVEISRKFDSLLRLWRYINHLLTYLLTYNLE